MCMKLRNEQRAVDNKQMYGIAKIAKTAAQARPELVRADYPAVLIALFLGYLADCAPERECLARSYDDAVYLLAGKVDIDCLILLKHGVDALACFDKVVAVR